MYYQNLRLPILFLLLSYLHLPLPGPTASEQLYMQEPGGKRGHFVLRERKRGSSVQLKFSGEGWGVTGG